ncbi:MAG: recombinase family protein [Bacteroidetes bacterium]|nr:recombinase family protein [Bacteroidota bacterium]
METTDIVIYTRVSTEEQKKQGFSLQEQERMLRQFALRNNYNVIEHYQEDYSAKDFNRPAFKGFLEDVESKLIRPKILLCVRIDRFSRNLYDSLDMISQLKKLGIEVQFADRNYDTGNPEDLIIKLIDMAIAQVFNGRISVNTKKGKREAQRKGRFMGRAPLGFTNNKLDKTVVINPNTAKHVVKAFELMASGIYYAEEVRRTLKDDGIYITKTKVFRFVTESVLLRNNYNPALPK